MKEVCGCDYIIRYEKNRIKNHAFIASFLQSILFVVFFYQFNALASRDYRSRALKFHTRSELPVRSSSSLLPLPSFQKGFQKGNSPLPPSKSKPKSSGNSPGKSCTPSPCVEDDEDGEGEGEGEDGGKSGGTQLYGFLSAVSPASTVQQFKSSSV